MKNSVECKAKGKREKVDRVSTQTKSDRDSETESIGRIAESINRTEDLEEKQVCVEVELTPTDHGRRCKSQKVNLLVDTGVHKSILCGTDWARLQKVDPMLRPKQNHVTFSAYGSQDELPMIGRTKAILRNTAGGTVESMVYIAEGGNQSLLGLRDARALGIIKVNRAGENNTEVIDTVIEDGTRDYNLE